MSGIGDAAQIRDRIARQKLARAKERRIVQARAKLAAQHAEKPVERFHQRMTRLKAAARREQHVGNGRWCILCTSSGRTLALAESLTAQGFEVWTPAHEAERRRGRARNREYVDAPILPGFVFAREEDLRALAAIMAEPVSRHPAFSIFVHSGRVPLIADHSMDGLRHREAAGLRDSEQRARKKASQSRRHLAVGTEVKIKDEPSFTGLIGVVEACDGRMASISFGGARRFEIPAWRLMTDIV